MKMKNLNKILDISKNLENKFKNKKNFIGEGENKEILINNKNISKIKIIFILW